MNQTALRVIRRPEVLKRTGLSKTTIYMLERAGQFPQSWLQTPRCAVWDASEVDAWIEHRRAQVQPAASRWHP